MGRKYSQFNITISYLSVLVFLTLLGFIPRPVSASTIDTATASNYNIRIDGSSASSKAGLIYKDLTHDINGNGHKDLVICEERADNNSRTNSGSCYVIYDSLLSTFTGTGNLIDLSDTSKWNLRFDGAVAGDALGNGGASYIDIDSDDETDLLLSSYGSDFARNRAGAVYVINHDIFGSLTGTGNTIDLNTSTNYSIRYDGATDPCEIGESFVKGIDMNDNGIDDLIMASGHCGLGGRSRSGALFIIYDSILSTYAGTGNTVDLATPSTFNLVFYEDTGSYFTISNDLVTQDIDGNGKVDIVTSITNGDKNGRTDSGSVVVIYDSIIDNFAGTGNYVDLTDTSNFNIRYDGVGEYDYFGWGGTSAADLNSNGRLDLILSSTGMDMNSRADSGSMFVLYDSLIDDSVGTGNIYDMTSSSNWNIRFDGSAAAEYFGGYHDDTFYDYDNDGLLDIVISASGAGYNSRAESGSIYIIYNPLFSSYAGTGNTVDMATTSNYTHRIDGATSGDYFGFYMYQDDIDGDSTYDLISAAYWASPLGRSSAGSDYVFYNFPHTLSQTTGTRNGSHVTVTGTITASNSTTNINGFQYQIDSNAQRTGWTDCSATDGDFNSTSEGFTCSITNAPTQAGTHTVYMRALNDLNVYTPQSRYLTYAYTIGGGSSGSTGHGRGKPQVSKNEGGRVTADIQGGSGAQSPTVILEDNSINFDARLEAQVHSMSKNYFDTPQGRAWFIGTALSLWFKDDNNGASILPSLQSKRSIISLSFTPDLLAISGKPGQSFSESQLRLSYSTDGSTWKIMPNSVVDESNNTVAGIDKVGGYYALVAITSSNSARQPAVQGTSSKASPQLPSKPAPAPTKIQVDTSPSNLPQPVEPRETFIGAILTRLRSFFAN